MPIRCADCHWLGVDHGGGDVRHASPFYRRTGGETNGPYPPACYERRDYDFQKQLPEEWRSTAKSPGDVQWKPIIEREWDCGFFTPFVLGRDPEQHRVVLAQERFAHWQTQEENRRREFDERRYQATLSREDERDARMRLREDLREEAAKDRHRDSMRILGGLLAAATIIAGVIAFVGQCTFQGNGSGTVHLPGPQSGQR